MSRAPASQFYWKDWADDAELARCSWAAQGVWMRVLGKLHQSGEYGVLRWPLKDIAKAAGVPLRYLHELATKNVLKGGDVFDTDFVHVPTHSGRKLEPVILVKADGGSCWFSARFVRDKWREGQRGKGSRFTTENQPSRSPDGRMGERLGDGPAFASASAFSFIDDSKRTESIRGGHESFALALRRNGFPDCSPHVPELADAYQAGVTAEYLETVAASLAGKGKPLVYVINTAIGKWRDKLAKDQGQPGSGSQPQVVDIGEQRRRAAVVDIEAKILMAQNDRRLGLIDSDDALAAVISGLEAQRAELQEAHS